MTIEPKTLQELCDRIIEYASSIPVREQIDGKWDTYYLTELPANLAIKHALTFIKEARIPHRIVDKETFGEG